MKHKWLLLREAEGGYCIALCVCIATGGVDTYKIVFYLILNLTPPYNILPVTEPQIRDASK